MHILTPSGYRDIADCVVGDEVAAFDMVTGAPLVNTIETIQWVDADTYRYWQNPRFLINDVAHLVHSSLYVMCPPRNAPQQRRIADLKVGDDVYRIEGEDFVFDYTITSIVQIDPYEPFAFYRVNGLFDLFAEQSIWRNDNSVCHAKDLVLGDVIFDDADQDVTITSIEQVTVEGWWRFDISGDHSYIVDGLTLHNASRFWVGGSGAWDASTTTHWAAVTNGAGGQTVPGSADTVTLDGSSGGGTVTVNTTVTVQSIACGAFTGTLDFSANNNNVTLSASNNAFNASGTGTRTINIGNGTWNFTGTGTGTAWSLATTTNLTFNANGSTIRFSGVLGAVSNTRTFTGGGLTYNALQIDAQANGGVTAFASANTFASVTAAGLNVLELQTTQTIATLALNGTASAPIFVRSSSDGAARTISVASNAPTMTYCAFRDFTGAGGASFVASNSFDLGHNSGITINGPGAVASSGLHAIDQGIAA
ncbi:hypothetical protein [Mesorhizobium sp. 128a]